jgi:PAS domain S-box-containing protein
VTTIQSLCDYEICLDEYLMDSSTILLCQYDQSYYEPAVLLEILRTHPLVIIGTEAYDNFYYISPAKALDRSAAQKLAHWIRNLTQHKQTDAALQKAEYQNRATLNAINDIIHVVDSDLRFVLVNQAFLKWGEQLGFDTDVVGRELAEVFPFLPKQVYEEYNHVFDTAELLVTTESTQVKGDEFVTETRKIPILEHDRVVQVITIIRDITDQKRAEATLKESEARFRNLAEQSPNMIFINKSGRIVYANRKCEELMGYSREEFYAADFDFLQLVIPEDRALARKNLGRHLHGEEIPPYEYTLQTRSGQRISGIHTTKLIQHEGETAILGIITDITQRKLAENALRESEEKFRNVAEQSPNMIFINRGGQTVYVNPRCEEVMGYTREELLDPAFDFLSLIAPEHREVTQENLRRHMEGMEIAPYEYTLITKTGRRLEAIYASKLIQHEGEPAILGTVTDITVPKQAQEELRKHAQEIETISHILRKLNATPHIEEAIPELVAGLQSITDCDRISLALSEESRTAFTLSTLYPAADHSSRLIPLEPTPSSALQDILAGQLHVTPDLSSELDFPIEQALFQVGQRSRINLPLKVEEQVFGAMSLSWSQPNGYDESQLPLLSQVTESVALALERNRLFEQVQRHAAELEQRVAERTAELRQSEETSRTQYKGIPIPTYTWQKTEEDFVLIDYNDAAVEATKGGITDYVGTSASEMYRDFPDILNDLQQCFHQQAAIEKEILYDFRMTGETRFLSVKYAFIPPDRVLVHAEDISERKQAEEQIRNRMAEVERLNQAMTNLLEDLQAANRKLEETSQKLTEANEELEAFAYSVSHDLRAPLRAIEGFAVALQEDYEKRIGPGGQEFIQRIIAASQRMDTLIVNLLTYSHLSRADLRLRRIDLDQIVQEGLELRAARIEAKNALITVEGPLPAVIGHRSTLEQIVANLVSNAIKFVEPDTQPQVRIWAEERGRWVRLWVEDNGIGIAQEKHEIIFGIFERLHGIETYPGTGIGLAVVQKGMQRMGGRVGVISELGKGSRFWIELECAQ